MNDFSLDSRLAADCHVIGDLALSRALAELMGGTLTVRSSVGAGARFTLTLPRG